MSDDNGSSAKKAKIVNPYAKPKTSVFIQKKTETQEIAPVSFSQAFETIEKPHNLPQTKPQEKAAKDRAAQRAFEESLLTVDAVSVSNHNGTRNSAFCEQSTTADPTNKNVSDRDMHILLEPHVLNVSEKQRGNNVLQYVRNVPYKFGTMVPDYIFGSTRCALFLSLKYHSLHPNYILGRIAALKQDFALRILLVLVDLDDNANILLYLNKLAVTNSMSLILGWSEEECGRYLETFKAFESKDASLIQKKESSCLSDQLADFLTAGGVNKTDAAQLLSQFGNIRSLTAASMDELGLVPGMGLVKVQKLHKALHVPFCHKASEERRRLRESNEIAPHNREKCLDSTDRTAKEHKNSDDGNEVEFTM